MRDDLWRCEMLTIHVPLMDRAANWALIRSTIIVLRWRHSGHHEPTTDCSTCMYMYMYMYTSSSSVIIRNTLPNANAHGAAASSAVNWKTASFYQQRLDWFAKLKLTREQTQQCSQDGWAVLAHVIPSFKSASSSHFALIKSWRHIPCGCTVWARH